MKSIFRYLLVFTCVSVFTACSNGDYTANPDSNTNGSINPLKPLKSSDFTWSGTDPVSGTINGSNWVASSYSYVFDSGKNFIMGFNGTQVLGLVLTNTYANNLYNMGYQQYIAYGYWQDTAGGITYSSLLGNSGGLWMVENDSAYLKGLFYFQAVSPLGGVKNITNGYFYIPKF